ncbi:MAG: hypothetical protein LUB59_04075 [Candidatus Gastranaerophilales bacterium]|nr:hypothetical protein [Candidatus Gastranaerophilales bacterium]
MNIKLFFMAIAMMIFCIAPACASYVDSFTTDADIKEALVMLKNAGADEVFANLEENSVKVIFYDLSLLSYDYRSHFAINSTDSFGNRYILINTRYKNASTEELACLIAHESFHKADAATLEEETLATEKEAYYWNLLKKTDKNYQASKLLYRLNSLVQLSNTSDEDNNLIQIKIINSAFYRQQLAIAH